MNTDNRGTMRLILDRIKEYDRIVISRHIRPDGDAVGSTMGLKRIINLSFPEKKVRLVNEDSSEYLSFLGSEDAAPPESFYEGALVIITDTGVADRISNKRFNLGKELIKIDHHIDDKPYGDISWVEDYRSSSCEMIAAFYDEFKGELTLDAEGALYLYTGMVTDSGRFRFRDVSGDTLRLAGALLDLGIDTERLFSNLYLDDFSYLKFKAEILRSLKITENGVAYLYVSEACQKKFGISGEQASNVISFLDSIKGSIIWLAFIENGDGTIRVRLRSRFVTVNALASEYRGGGHDRASGATLYSKKEMKALLADADALIKDYKENNGGWM